MSRRLREFAPLGLVLLLALAMFLPGIDWGLPSHAVDSFLFGKKPVWTGAEIYRLSGGWDADAALGADVARHPLEGSENEGGKGGPILVNGDDAERARIMQRYRLYSDQPDEMITFRALSGIDPRHEKLDPKLYQYGGLWIYGVGGMLAVARVLGAITVRRDVAYYLDHPEAFGRFYVVARLYAAFWGLVLVAAVYAVMRQMGSRRLWAAIAAAAVTLMPVVVNAAHEAKPHLPGAALLMLAVWAGCGYLRVGHRRMLLACGALCGAATGMVLWAAPGFVLVVGAGLLATSRAAKNPAAARRRGAGAVSEPGSATPVERRLSDIAPASAGSNNRSRLLSVASAIAIGIAVYAITNPYVVIHLFHDLVVLRSNLQNTSAMYGVHSGWGAGANAARLAIAGMSPLLAVAGIAGAVALAVRKGGAWRGGGESGAFAAAWRGGKEGRGGGMLLAMVAIVMGVPYVMLAAGKPGEYGRFALVPDVALAMAAVLAIETFARRTAIAAAAAGGVLLVATGVFGMRYVSGFCRDAGGDTSRMAAAATLAAMPGDRLAIAAVPAPYCLPPVDLFRWKLLLLPRWNDAEADRIADRSCRATDDYWATPLSWANKRFLISGR